MTIFPALIPRRIDPDLPPTRVRTFAVADHSSITADCNFFDKRGTTVIIVHGLEGSSRAPNVTGLANKALRCGFNTVRINLRNCGNTMLLTPTLYNAGLSADVIAVARELRRKDGIEKVCLAGYSLGGNIVIKAAAELGEMGTESRDSAEDTDSTDTTDSSDLIAAVCGISPAIDLAPCVEAMEKGFNQLYEQRFLIGLKMKVRRKKRAYPHLYDLTGLREMHRLRIFDDTYTSMDAGYDSAAAYYAGASALNVIDRAKVPILLITAQDDPIVPYKSFSSPKLKSPLIELLAPEYGGHGGFFAQRSERAEQGRPFDRFWAENRCLQFLLAKSG